MWCSSLLPIEEISIHAPRTGSDGYQKAGHDPAENFNPRSPHGERQYIATFPPCIEDFNPRSPHGERP